MTTTPFEGIFFRYPLVQLAWIRPTALQPVLDVMTTSSNIDVLEWRLLSSAAPSDSPSPHALWIVYAGADAYLRGSSTLGISPGSANVAATSVYQKLNDFGGCTICASSPFHLAAPPRYMGIFENDQSRGAYQPQRVTVIIDKSIHVYNYNRS